jgi:hypothetical protein
MSYVARLAAAGTICLTLGCDALKIGTVCTTEARPGLFVTVLDSVTKSPITGASVTARSGTTSDVVPDFESARSSYYLAYEKAGTYSVTVEKAGYLTWSRTNVRVTSHECHVKTVALTALLQAQP